MTKQPKTLKIRRPDDWHVHLRDGKILQTIVPYTSNVFRRAMIMPNLIPPITTISAAVSYRNRIINAIPNGHNFIPLMTCYLTDSLDPNEIERGLNEGVFTAGKLYPMDVTTNSGYGIADIDCIMPILERMEKIGMPLLVHGEINDASIDIFDREARFIEMIIEPLRQRLQGLKIVLEHISTKDAVEYLRDSNKFLAATITPQHLMFNRNHMLANGIHPHFYCFPVLKSHVHQKALRELATSGFNRVFLGTDSAPHTKNNKEAACGHAGCFSSPMALSSYATVFEEMHALEHFEAFCSLNGPRFYGLHINEDTIELTSVSNQIINSISLSNDSLIPLLAGETTKWTILN